MSQPRTFCVAPMMDWTDRHDRYFLRQISGHAYLYTEMVTTGAVLNGDRDYLIGFDPAEHPVAVQLGGSDPQALADSAQICQEYGYDEVNLNVGCPSDRVQNGRFGACLMLEPDLVAKCITAMQQAVEVPVTVKCRIGVDEQDEFEDLDRFVAMVSDHGCSTFIVHARKAWLKGLSPKQNREVPPLNYQRVYELKERYPELEIIINGGITDLDQCQQHLQHVDGVMLGREAYHNPYILAEVDQRFYRQSTQPPTRNQVVDKMLPYVKQQLSQGVKLQSIVRHMMGLFHGQPGGKKWRRYLSEQAHRSEANESTIEQAVSAMLQSGAPSLMTDHA